MHLSIHLLAPYANPDYSQPYIIAKEARLQNE